MSEQTVTYVDLKFCTPPKEKTKQKGKPSRIPVRRQIEILSQQEEVLKSLTQLNETLENCTLERDNFKAQNTNLKGEKCSAYSDCWKPHGEKFYYFTKERKSYQECKAHCSSHGSKLLKIENKDEMNFLNPLAHFHWLGLTRKGIASDWKWEDGAPHPINLFPVMKSQPGKSCAVFNAGQAYSNSCDEQQHCACMKPAK